MALVGLQILSGVGLRAEMDLALFSSDEEEMVLIGVEVEAHTAGEAVSERFLFVVEELLFLIGDELKLDDLFSLKFVLHEVPVGHTAIGGDRVEVQILAGLFGLPADLPHGVGVLGGTHG
jgi:hypothetical protein